MVDETPDFDPFNAPPNPDEEQDALIASLRMARKFVLLFAVTNSATERNARMKALEETLPGMKIQRVPANTETENLLWHLREKLTDPKPDAVFVYGLENWISGAVNPRSIPFLLNLNAARDSFPLVFPAPMVLWIPQYVFRAIADAAPDFFSVRSGVYQFPLDPVERDNIAGSLMQLGEMEVMGYSQPERAEHIHELRGLLSEYQSLSDEQRDLNTESNLMNSLAAQLHAEGRYADALPVYKRALSLARESLPAMHTNTAAILSNFGLLLKGQGDLSQAESHYKEALEIKRRMLPPLHRDTAITLNNLAVLYMEQGREQEAALCLQEALEINRGLSKSPTSDVAMNLSNLAGLYINQGDYTLGEELYREATKIMRLVLSAEHPNLATSLNNLAFIYEKQGKIADAEPIYEEAVSIFRESLGRNHPDTKAATTNFIRFRQMMERQETAPNAKRKKNAKPRIEDSFRSMPVSIRR